MDVEFFFIAPHSFDIEYFCPIISDLHDDIFQPSSMISHSILQSCPPETKTLRDLLLGTGLSSTKTVLSNTAVTRTYTTQQYVPVGSTHRYVPFTNTTTCKLLLLVNFKK